ncbi:hypothetical protein QFC19_002737 [Naganishia cerealis]|uniref:Uncharacterized protein n=1 Tax=Naganishia cerealis TaxID=610337 RepID=A0ACC2WAF3_9TREE|nr:hypothetical protein QFC19_002737 [Naganishia cerealis]
MENKVREKRRHMKEREPLAHGIESASKITPPSSTRFYYLWLPTILTLGSYEYSTDRQFFESEVKPVFEHRKKEAFWRKLVIREPLLSVEDGQCEATDSSEKGSDVVRSDGPSTIFTTVTPHSWKSIFHEMSKPDSERECTFPLSTTLSASAAPLCQTSGTSANEQSGYDAPRCAMPPPPPPSPLPPRKSDYAPSSSIATSTSTSGPRTIVSGTTRNTHVSIESSTGNTSPLQSDK